MDNAGSLKRTCIHLGDADRLAISRIRDLLDVPSDALVVRYAVRYLDRRLQESPPKTLLEMAKALGGRETPHPNQPAPEGKG